MSEDQPKKPTPEATSPASESAPEPAARRESEASEPGTTADTSPAADAAADAGEDTVPLATAQKAADAETTGDAPAPTKEAAKPPASAEKTAETSQAADAAADAGEDTVPLTAAKKKADVETSGDVPAAEKDAAEPSPAKKKTADVETSGDSPVAEKDATEPPAAAEKTAERKKSSADPAAKKAAAEKKAKAAAARKAKAESAGDAEGASEGKEKKKKGLPAKDYILVGATSPHVLSGETIPRIMFTVCLTLVPAILVGVYAFGLEAVKVLLLTVGACIATEAGLQRWMGRKITINDGSAAVTGLLLAMTLPPSVPWWICVLGGMIAIGIGKQIFGGLAHNPFNPALLSRVVLLISWPVELTTWMKPNQGFANLGADVVTGASQLGQMKEGLIQQGSIEAAMQQFNAWDAFLGIHQYGSLAETSAVALLIGGIYLLYRGYITWHIPVGYMGTVALIAAGFWLYDPSRFASPLYHMLTGGLFLGAIYMATDMVTCPVSNLGMFYFGVGCGVLTYLIRTFGGYPEGVSFAIVIMNGTVPLIERWVRPRTYGTKLPSTV
ncbi:MAG: RnfABCDGE type electron transport complex subunit D [Nitrospirota bacterium]|jgi:electron transport complex protein RnfD